jgi:hypothetical protein
VGLTGQGVSRAKVLSNTVKQKRKEKAGKWSVPLPKVRAIADDEMFKILKSGKRRNNMYAFTLPSECCLYSVLRVWLFACSPSITLEVHVLMVV